MFCRKSTFVLAALAFAVLGFSFPQPAFAGGKWCKHSTLSLYYCRSLNQTCPSTITYPVERGVDCSTVGLKSTACCKDAALGLSMKCDRTTDPQAFNINADPDSSPAQITVTGKATCQEWKVDKNGNPTTKFGPSFEVFVTQEYVGSHLAPTLGSDFEGCTATKSLISGTDITKVEISCNTGRGKKGNDPGDQRAALWRWIPQTNTDFVCSQDGPGEGPTLFPNCWVNEGLPPVYTDANFAPETLDGIFYGQGEYLKYTYLIKNGKEYPQKWGQRVYTSGTFDGDAEIKTASGKLRQISSALGEGIILVGLDLGPKFDEDVNPDDQLPFLFSRAEGYLVGRILGRDIDVSTIDITPPSDLKLNGVGATSAELVLNESTGILDLIAQWKTTDLDAAGALTGSPGQVKSFTVTGKATLGDVTSDIVGTDTVKFAQSVFVDYRAGCGFNLSLQNISNLGTDNISLNGGPAPYHGDPANNMSGQVAGGATVFVEGNPFVNPPVAGTPLTGLSEVDVSGLSCGNTAADGTVTGDGTTDGTTDLRGTISVTNLFANSSKLQNAVDNEVVGLLVTGTSKNGVPWKGFAYVKVNK